MTAFAIHEDLVNEGIDPTTDDYYTEVDNRIRNSFANLMMRLFAEKPTRSSGSTSQRGAKTGRKSVNSPSQVAIAKKLGVPLEEYAKYVK